MTIKTQMGIYSDNIFVDWRLVELATAVAANVAVVPRNYVIGIAIRTPHYAALHW